MFLLILKAEKRFRAGEDKHVLNPTAITDREPNYEAMCAYIKECRRAVEVPAYEETREAENRVGDWMQHRFGDEYVPLNYHLMRFQEANLMKQYSDLTPEEELSVFNLYLGGEGQTEERMSKIAPKKPSKKAKKQVASDEEL